MFNLRDTPIRELGDDRLGRASFAKLLARALLSDRHKEGVVIGVNGAWGTGKTSVAQMTLAHVGKNAEIVLFNPWMVGTRDELIQEFFVTLGQSVFKELGGEAKEEKRKRFYRYGSKVVASIGIAANTLGVALPGMVLIGKTADAISGLLDITADGLEARAGEPTLMELKNAISADLATLPKPVIVVIDDIDRLEAEEVRALLQLVKACADFPNVRYLLLFDRRQLTFALRRVTEDPDAYVEKIVSQIFDLPQVTVQQSAEILDEAISLLGFGVDLEREALDRLEMVFEGVLLPALTTVRQIKRFVSMTDTLLPGVVADGFRNVDPADYLCLEYLRQHAPDVYECIKSEDWPNPGGVVERIANYDELKEKLSARRESAITSLAEPRLSLVREALRWMNEGLSDGAVSSRRFQTDYWRPVYLGFTEARAVMTEAEWYAARTSFGSIESTVEWIAQWCNESSRSRATTTIAVRAADLSGKQSLLFLIALFQWGEGHPNEPLSRDRDFVTWDEAVSVCTSAILEAAQGDASLHLLRKAIGRSKTLVSPSVVLAAELEARKHRMGNVSTSEELDLLVPKISLKLTTLVLNGSIWSRPDPTVILSSFMSVNPAAYEKWFANLTNDHETLANYLNLVLGARRHDDGLLAWKFDEPFVTALEAINLNLLTDDGRWARTHCIESAERLRRSR